MSGYILCVYTQAGMIACIHLQADLIRQSVWQLLRAVLMPSKFGLAIMYGDACRLLPIEYVTGHLEAVSNVPDLELCGDSQPHIAALICQWRVAFGT